MNLANFRFPWFFLRAQSTLQIAPIAHEILIFVESGFQLPLIVGSSLPFAPKFVFSPLSNY